MDFESQAAAIDDAPCADGTHTLSVALLLGTRRVVSRSVRFQMTADREIVLQLDRCDGVCTAECVEGVCASPASPTPPRAVLATVEASSTRGAGRAQRAFDADLATAWCPSRASSTLTVRFAEPVSVRALTVRARPARSDTDEDPPPLPLTVTSDAGAVSVALPTTDQDVDAIALAPAPTGTLTIQADGCLTEIHLELADRAMVFGVPPEALASLETAIAHLDRALLRDDTAALAQLARFPVGFRETSPAERGTYEPHARRTDRAAYRTVRAIPSWAAARRLDPPRPRRPPQIDRGIAPGVVRVLAGYAIEDVHWELAWRAGTGGSCRSTLSSTSEPRSGSARSEVLSRAAECVADLSRIDDTIAARRRAHRGLRRSRSEETHPVCSACRRPAAQKKPSGGDSSSMATISASAARTVRT